MSRNRLPYSTATFVGLLIGLLLHVALHPPCIEHASDGDGRFLSAPDRGAAQQELAEMDHCPCGDDATGEESHHHCVCPCHLSLTVDALQTPFPLSAGGESTFLWSGRPVGSVIPTETPPPRLS